MKIELNKEQWKELEKQYSKCVKILFRPPLWAKDGIDNWITSTQYQMALAEISLLENQKTKMKYIGTSTNEEDGDYVEYYLNDDKLYTYLYKEKLEYIDDEENELEFDVIHTGNYTCELICINESEIKEGVA